MPSGVWPLRGHDFGLCSSSCHSFLTLWPSIDLDLWPREANQLQVGPKRSVDKHRFDIVPPTNVLQLCLIAGSLFLSNRWSTKSSSGVSSLAPPLDGSFSQDLKCVCSGFIWRSRVTRTQPVLVYLLTRLAPGGETENLQVQALKTKQGDSSSKSSAETGSTWEIEPQQRYSERDRKTQ